MPSFGQPISLRGPQGLQGPEGLTPIVYAGPPTGTASEGQAWIDTLNFTISHYTNGAYVTSASFRGLQGVAGSNASFFFGQGAPTAGNPSVPDGTNAIYLQANGEIWSWAAGASSWTDTGENWTGPAGQVGATGRRGSVLFEGNGPPPSDASTLSVGDVHGALPGDTYRDVSSPDVKEYYYS